MNDIFISYAHRDNQHEWVTRFHEALSVQLAEFLGRDANIWRDKKIQGTDVFPKETFRQLADSSILICIISPSYLNSKWCKDELNGFQSTGRTRFANKSRIVKVVKTPIDLAEYPEAFQELLGYDFFEKNEDGPPIELSPLENAPTYDQFHMQLATLAYHLSDLIKKIEEEETETPPCDPLKTVYLAETTSDLFEERENIRIALENETYTVLPRTALPLDGTFQDSVRSSLKQCRLSVHLVGGKYGSRPEDEDKSVLELQHQFSGSENVKRLIWLLPGLEITNDKQKEFIRRLENETRADELLKLKFEDFKTVLLDTLRDLNKPAPATISAGDPLHVYLICDQKDRDTVDPLKEYLFRKGFEVKQPLFEGSPRELQELHRQYLSLCDVMMIYYDSASPYWLESKMNELLKASGYPRSRPVRERVVYVSGKKTSHKEEFRSNFARVLKHWNGVNPGLLEPIFSQLRAGGVQ